MTEGNVPDERRDNRTALSWSLRLFLVGYTLVPVAMVSAFVFVASLQPYFVSEGTTVLALVLLLCLIVLIGFFLTLWRTPRQLVARGGETVELRYLFWKRPPVDLGVGTYYLTLETYPKGVFLREDCELVEIHGLGKSPRKEVVVEGLLDGVIPRRERKFTRADPPAHLLPFAAEDLETGS